MPPTAWINPLEPYCMILNICDWILTHYELIKAIYRIAHVIYSEIYATKLLLLAIFPFCDEFTQVLLIACYFYFETWSAALILFHGLRNVLLYRYTLAFIGRRLLAPEDDARVWAYYARRRAERAREGRLYDRVVVWLWFE